MTEPNEPRPRATGPATILGVVLGPFVMYLLASVGGALVLPVFVVAAVGAIVMIARGRQPWRALGIGLLIGFAIVLLLLGALFAICASTSE